MRSSKMACRVLSDVLASLLTSAVVLGSTASVALSVPASISSVRRRSRMVATILPHKQHPAKPHSLQTQR